MKKLLPLFVLVVVGVFLSGCGASAQGITQNFVDLPDTIKNSITGLVIALFALGFDYLIGRVAWLEFLRKYQMEWAIMAASSLIVWLEGFLPTGYEDVSIKGIAFLLALIFVFVPYLVARKAFAARGVKAFR